LFTALLIIALLVSGTPADVYDRGQHHRIGAKVLLALLIGHAGAALFHHYIKKDATLRRIGFGRS